MTTSGPGVELAVRLVRQAVHQDSRQNYPEAARCYREAILILQDLKTSRSSTCKELQIFLDTKLVQYVERLRIIEQHLLSNSDLSKFFKELESCHFDDCGSSVSSDTKHLYKNPLLIKALDLIRSGRKDDERRDYVSALKKYESGLALLLEVLNKGLLTERQAETARVKCLLYHDRADSIRGFLESGKAGSAVSEVREYGREDCVSLDSDCESPVPVTETDEVLDMMEIRSCSSRLGSTQSLVATERPVKMSSTRSLEGDQMAESLHSLYPVCEIKQSPSVMSVRSNTVPLASITKEISLSELSIASSPSSSSSSRRLSRSVMSNMEKISVLEISNDDTYDPELAELLPSDRCCDDAKSDQGSDSGYSDPSPDGTVRDSKSPSESLDLAADRKSPFSDLSEREDAGSPGKELFKSTSTEEVIPNIIIVNESVQQQQGAASLSSPRQMGRQLRQRTQNTRLQNPNKDRIVSQLSQDKVAVCDQTDSGWVKPEIRVKHPRKEVKIAAVPDVYSPRVRGPREYIPPRALAHEPRGEHGDMNKGCYYMMAAMDFCWCL